LSGLVEHEGDDGKGLERILPAKQGSQTVSGFSDEANDIPVTKSSLCILAMSAKL